jgi:hypothetical protein
MGWHRTELAVYPFSSHGRLAFLLVSYSGVSLSLQKILCTAEKGSVLVLTVIDEGVKPVSCLGNGPVRVATLNVEPEEQNVFILK